MTLREELKAQLAEEAAARNGTSSRKLSSRRNLPVSARATADGGGLIDVHLPNGGARQLPLELIQLCATPGRRWHPGCSKAKPCRHLCMFRKLRTSGRPPVADAPVPAQYQPLESQAYWYGVRGTA